MPVSEDREINFTSDQYRIYGSPLNNYGLTDKELQAMHGIYYADEKTDKYKNFNRFYRVYNNDELESMTAYVFLIRPDLNIVSNSSIGDFTPFANKYVKQDPTFNYLYYDNPENVKALTEEYAPYHDYISYLVGRTESFQVTDYNLQVNDVAQLFTGYKFQYPGNAIDSKTGVSFDITFREDKDLNVSKMFYCWCYYIDGILRNNFAPKDIYKFNRVADYMTSIYYIVCGPDGKEIKYYEKIVGAFPIGVPLSNLSFNRGSSPDNKVTISFAGASSESMNPLILSEFNYNSHIKSAPQHQSSDTRIGLKFRGGITTNPAIAIKESVESYNSNLLTGVDIVGTPWIHGNGTGKFYLMWKNKNSL